jgi:hypothetical protein
MTIALASDVVPTVTEHGTVLLDERRGRYFRLNSAAALVLSALLDGGDEGQAASLLRERFGIGAQRASADVAALLDALRAARLIRS